MEEQEKRDATRERVLDAAEELFAEKGYHAVSVREITGKAGCNLSAVNYHFGNKEKLYVAVFRDRWASRAHRLQAFFKKALSARESLSTAAVIETLARAFIEGPLSDAERQRHFQLMAREMASPTRAFELLTEEIIRPFFEELAGLLRSVLPRELEDERLMLNILSMFATILYFNFARLAVTRITGRQYDPAFKSRLVEHIAEFSLRGLGVDREEKIR